MMWLGFSRTILCCIEKMILNNINNKFQPDMSISSKTEKPKSNRNIKVTSFYKFFPIEKKRLQIHKQQLQEELQKLNIRGLVILAEEGLNTTLCGTEKSLEQAKKNISQIFKETFFWKDSYCKEWNFKRLSVKTKKEIINVGMSYIGPYKSKEHLTPEDWEKKLKNKPQILDVRNTYEVVLGRFKMAQDLALESFQEFPQKLKQWNMDKNKDTLIYCTGGIRCEKALPIMKKQGFKKVYQLKGGILSYLKKYPNSSFEQDCFVFDHRVVLNQNLEPSQKYTLCPHCGQPGDQKISCNHCNKPATTCKICLQTSPHYKTCSKNCAYHFKKGHTCRRKIS